MAGVLSLPAPPTAVVEVSFYSPPIIMILEILSKNCFYSFGWWKINLPADRQAPTVLCYFLCHRNQRRREEKLSFSNESPHGLVVIQILSRVHGSLFTIHHSPNLPYLCYLTNNNDSRTKPQLRNNETIAV